MAQEKDAGKTRVLVVFAHPDDAEFTSGGTLARWAAEGRKISYAVLTDGSRGSSNGQIADVELVVRRKAEQCEAAGVLGVNDVIFIGRKDGEIVADDALKAELVCLIRGLKPDVLLTWDPWRPCQLHSDHRPTGLAALDAVMAAGNVRYFPEQLRNGQKTHQVEEIYLFGTDSPDRWVDISDTFTRKIEAISRHKSQVADITKIKKEIGSWNRSLGKRKGFAYAEAFKVIKPVCEICR